MKGPARDVIVIGAGVIGMACALALARAGAAVTVLERKTPGAGAALGNCGTITPSHAIPLSAPGIARRALLGLVRPEAALRVAPSVDPALWRWLLEFVGGAGRRRYDDTLARRAVLLPLARDRLRELVATLPTDCVWRDSGLDYVFSTRASLRRARHEAATLADLGIESTELSAEALTRDQPALAAGFAGGLRFAGDASLRPDAYFEGLVAAALAAGVEIQTGQGDLRLKRGINGVSIQAADGHLHHAEHIVLAAGAWSAAVAADTGLRLPIMPGKGYSLTWSEGPALPRPIVLSDQAVCLSAWPGGFRIGSTMEFAGFDESMNTRRLDVLRLVGERCLRHSPSHGEATPWYGFRPMSVDELPLIGRVQAAPNVIVASGHGMLGVTLSAWTADVVAAIALGVRGTVPRPDARPLLQRIGLDPAT